MSTLSPIRVAPGGRYFETFDGAPFLFIGFNDALPWPGLAPLYRRKNPEAVDAYLEELASSGVTVLRLMLEYAHGEHRYFERPAGRFNPALVRFWDDLFARCERVGLRILLAPWDNYWLARRWHRHPYNAANGGPAIGPHSFFTDEATIAATERRLRFVAERWGGSGALAAWDLFNEIDVYWGGTPTEQSAVITRLSDAVRETEERVWGFTRPQTVSIYGPQPSPEYEELIFRHSRLDFATTHIYHEGTIDYPLDTVHPALAMAHWVRHGLARTPPDRPFLDTEHGPIHLFNDHQRHLAEDFDDEYERHLMWAHLAAGGAGSGMRWPARHPHQITAGTRRALRGLSAFTKLVDWRCFTPRDAVPEITLGVVAPGSVHVLACRDARQAVIWLLRSIPDDQGPSSHRMLPRRAPLHGVSLALPGFAPGSDCCVHSWDTAEGRSAGCRHERIGADGVLRATLPDFGSDLAVAVTPA